MSTDIVPYQQIERMANAVAKSGLFAVKSPEAAVSLMLIAQAEGIHPAQAMMDYDVIQGKPALKASAMLARFQRAGGTVEWIEASDQKVSGMFTHPAGGTVTVTWDDARVQQAGLTNPMHKKFPQQMKRARCISEGVRAVCPGVTPLNMYTPEETVDMDAIEVSATTTASQRVDAMQGAPLPTAEVESHLEAIRAANAIQSLKIAFQIAHKAAVAAKDAQRIGTFQLAYEARKGELERPIDQPQETAA